MSTLARSQFLAAAKWDQAADPPLAEGISVADIGGAVLFGLDDRLLEGVRAFEHAGADQVLFAGSVVEGTEQLEQIEGLLRL